MNNRVLRASIGFLGDVLAILKRYKSIGGALICIVCLPTMSGCGTAQGGLQPVSAVTPNFFGIGEELARQLMANRREGDSGGKLIFATLVNLDDLRQTSKFGRTMSESLATQLFQHGYGVVELRKVANVMIQAKNGEMVLSRDAARLARQYEANAIVAGTYSLTPKTVIVNVKLLDAGSQEVLSVAGMELERSAAINFMLADEVGRVDGPVSGYER